MSPRRTTTEGTARIARALVSLMPAPDGGPPPAVTTARSRASALLLLTVSLAVGAASGFLVVLAAAGLPDLPGTAVGFAGGAVTGAAGALLLTSRFPAVRKAGGIAILSAPLLLLAAPFLWIGALVGFLGRTRPRRRRPDRLPGTASGPQEARLADPGARRPRRASARRGPTPRRPAP